MPHNRKLQSKDFLRGMTIFSQIGIRMAFCVFLGVFAGQFLDKRFGTSPWLLLVFSLLGMAATFKVLYDFTKIK